LLRFLQDQKYRPLGSERELQTNVRVVAATNQTLASVMRQGHFRSDLLYRLQILHLEVPALRDRQGDAVLLANHFARMLCARYQMPCKTFSADTLAWVRQHPWPGNVRELESWVHRELLMGDGPLIGNHPPPQQALPCGRQGHAISSFHDAKAEAVRQFERDYVIAAYLQAQGNVTRAAEIAGKERRAFGKLLKKHGVDRNQLPQALQPPSAGPVQPQGQ
jgi:DNA-binding NtrC family response regulator